jgi:hypothetical protein
MVLCNVVFVLGRVWILLIPAFVTFLELTRYPHYDPLPETLERIPDPGF